MTNYHPPVDIVGFGTHLPERPIPTPRTSEDLHLLEIGGYSFIAGVRDGAPFVWAPRATKEEAVAALQQILDALEALQ